MALKALVLVLLVTSQLGLLAQALHPTPTPAEGAGEGGADPRLFLLNGANDGTQTITIGGDTAFFLGLLITGLAAAVIVMGVLLGVEGAKGLKYNDSGYGGYSATSSYGTAPAYHDSSYSIHRSLEDGAKKFE